MPIRSDRDHQTTADFELRLQGFRDLRSAGRDGDGIVGSMIGPAGDNAEFTDLIWVRLRLIAGREALSVQSRVKAEEGARLRLGPGIFGSNASR